MNRKLEMKVQVLDLDFDKAGVKRQKEKKIKTLKEESAMVIFRRSPD